MTHLMGFEASIEVSKSSCPGRIRAKYWVGMASNVKRHES